jgi:hypothetical protein
MKGRLIRIFESGSKRRGRDWAESRYEMRVGWLEKPGGRKKKECSKWQPGDLKLLSAVLRVGASNE